MALSVLQQNVSRVDISVDKLMLVKVVDVTNSIDDVSFQVITQIIIDNLLQAFPVPVPYSNSVHSNRYSPQMQIIVLECEL